MKKIFFLTIFCTTAYLAGETWSAVELPNEYEVPHDLNSNVYSTQLPSSPVVWERTSECGSLQSTNIHWKSDFIFAMKGISFKGLVFQLPELKDKGSALNSFAIFFHEQECYAGGVEYGWLFQEKALPNAKFYICNNCNVEGSQKWSSWPTDGFKVLEGDEKAMKHALSNSGVYRYWNIKITIEGNFILELINPSNYKKLAVTLKKPTWFPNVYDASGYITITAKKREETFIQPPYMHVDVVKVFK